MCAGLARITDPSHLSNVWLQFGVLLTQRSRGRLAIALKHIAPQEIMLWMTPSEAPKALQTSECSELLDPTGANCWIFARH